MATPAQNPKPSKPKTSVTSTARTAAAQGIAIENPVLGAVAMKANERHEQKKAVRKEKAQAAKTSTTSTGGKSKLALGATVGTKLGNKNLLLGEMIVCLVILAWGTIVAPEGSDDGVHRMMIKGSALLAVFFVLAITSMGGKGAQKTASALGLLITLSYALTSSDVRNIMKWSQSYFTSANASTVKAKTPDTTLPPASTASQPPSATYV